MQSRLVHASTRIATTGLSPERSYTLSTRFNGLSDRSKFKYIFGGVLVSINMFAAIFTRKSSRCKCQVLVNVPTGIASLRTREESICETKLLLVPSAFVIKHKPKLAKRSAGKMFRESWMQHHPRYIQIFYCDNVKSTHKICCKLIQKILTSVRNVGVKFGNFGSLALPSSAFEYSPIHDALQSCKFRRMARCMSWICDSFSRGKSRKPINSQVDPDLLPSLRKCCFNWFIQAKRHEISPRTILVYRNRGGITRECAAPLDSEATDFGNFKAESFCVPRKGTKSILGSLLVFLGVELRVFGSFGKKICKCALKMANRLLLDDTGTCEKPFKRWIISMLGPFQTAFGIIDRLAVLEAVRAKFKTEIVGMARTTKLFFKLLFLAFCRVTSESLPLFHTNNLYCVNIVSR